MENPREEEPVKQLTTMHMHDVIFIRPDYGWRHQKTGKKPGIDRNGVPVQSSKVTVSEPYDQITSWITCAVVSLRIHGQPRNSDTCDVPAHHVLRQ